MIIHESWKGVQNLAAAESWSLVASRIVGQCELHEACMKARPSLYLDLGRQLILVA